MADRQLFGRAHLAENILHFARVLRKAGLPVGPAKVIAALEALKYDFYKGPQYYRKCDHQSVQSVLVIKSKSKDMRNESDVFEVISTDEPNEANLRSCAELGHKS